MVRHGTFWSMKCASVCEGHNKFIESENEIMVRNVQKALSVISKPGCEFRRHTLGSMSDIVDTASGPHAERLSNTSPTTEEVNKDSEVVHKDSDDNAATLHDTLRSSDEAHKDAEGVHENVEVVHKDSEGPAAQLNDTVPSSEELQKNVRSNRIKFCSCAVTKPMLESPPILLEDIWSFYLCPQQGSIIGLLFFRENPL